jgi:hypothetical protein
MWMRTSIHTESCGSGSLRPIRANDAISGAILSPSRPFSGALPPELRWMEVFDVCFASCAACSGEPLVDDVRFRLCQCYGIAADRSAENSGA